MPFRFSTEKHNLIRRVFTAYVVASILPILFLIYLFLGAMGNRENDRLYTTLSFAIPSIILLSFSGFLLLFFSLRSIKTLRRRAEQALIDVGKPRASMSTDEIDRLSGSVVGILDELRKKIAEIEDYSTQLSQANRKLLEMSTIDELTGLYNFRYFRTRLDEEWNRAKRYGRNLCLIIADIDDFKKVNDSFGHLTGNGILQELAALWRYSIRKSDQLARYGGEEFALILTETDIEGGLQLAEHLRRALEQYRFKRLDAPEPLIQITASFGVAMCTDAVVTCDELLEEADKHLFAAKRAGKNCVRYNQLAFQRQQRDTAR
jgi:diguanylate cyclase (GGDEF)-like protein